MSEFKEIKTQEEFDAAIKDRLERAEKSARESAVKELNEKYADYETIKKQNGDYADEVSKLKESAKENETKLSENGKTIEELNSKIKAYETDSVKTRIGLENNLPYEMIKRINGTTEEEIKKDAEALAKFVGGGNSAPGFSGEPADGYAKDTKQKALRELAKGLKKE